MALDLTTLELRIVTTLTEPLPATELFDILQVGYPYAIKVLRKLKKDKVIGEVKKNGKPYYYTIRTSETEDIFSARAEVTGKTQHLFPFRGEWHTVVSAQKLIQHRNKQKQFELVELCARVIMNLQYNSYRRENNMPTQRPYAEDMRRVLEIHLANARIEVQFAEELLRAPIWNDSKNDWKAIGIESPDLDKGKLNSDTLSETFYGRGQ